jgi:hypothetical protein
MCCVVEPVVIENISTHGARVVASRSCVVHDSVVIIDPLGVGLAISQETHHGLPQVVHAG